MARDEIVISVGPGESVFARLEGGRLAAYESETTLFGDGSDDPPSAVAQGDIVLTRIVKVLASAKGALTDLGDGVTGFLPLKADMPLITAGPDPSIHEGQTVFAQVSRLGLDGKGPRLTSEISLPGRHCVFLPKGDGVNVSRKLDKSRRAEIAEALKTGLGAGQGAIVRSAASQSAAVLNDLNQLQALWTRIEVAARQARPPARLWRDGPALTRLLRDWMSGETVRIVTDDRAVARDSAVLLQAWGLEDVTVDLIAEPGGALAHADLEAQIEALFERTVLLPGGGSIVLDRTEALTAIDVNGGGDGAGTEAARLGVNLEAVTEIARHLTLRDIGGLIVIDFLDLGTSSSRARLETALKQALRKDPAPSRIGSLSVFGTLELTRQRSGTGVLDRATALCPTCHGTGRIRSADQAGLTLLRQVQARVRQAPRGLTVRMGAALTAWTHTHGEAIRERLERCGIAMVSFEMDSRLSADGWEIVETG